MARCKPSEPFFDFGSSKHKGKPMMFAKRIFFVAILKCGEDVKNRGRHIYDCHGIVILSLIHMLKLKPALNHLRI
jgi:hypothetical protein